jgi:predicted TIM-barrel fold metal-dependent hydrolase
MTSESVRDLRTYFPGREAEVRPVNVRSGRNFAQGQEIFRTHAERGWTADCQLEAMDVEGIDVAVLFPTRGLSILTLPNIEPPFAAAIARAYNDWMFDFCRADPARLLGAGMLSVHDVNEAIREAERAAKELGFRAVFLRSNLVNGTTWHDPYYEPLWSTLERLNMPLGFHEATGSRSRQTADCYDANFGIKRVYAQPFEQMLGLGSLLCGGVLERHPNLKVAILEANCSWVPWLLWRMDEGYEREGDVFMPDLKIPPSAYFKRQCVVSIEPDETPALGMMDEYGEYMVFSTDYPHTDSKYPEAVDAFLDLPITEEAKRRILWDNCARFYSVNDGQASPGARPTA